MELSTLVELPAKPAFSIIDTPEMGYAPPLRLELWLTFRQIKSPRVNGAISTSLRFLGIAIGLRAQLDTSGE
jgi:hypothetical protein